MSVDLKIDWCSHKAAKYAVEHWHYSKSLPSASVKIGIWENSKFIGCLIFGRGASSEIGSPYSLKQTEICELVRIALKEHQTEVTKIISISIKMLRKLSPGIRMIVSFADSTQGHHGGIYQGGNWVFTGSNEYHAYHVNGKIVHPKTLHSIYGIGGQSIPWLRKNVDANAERIKNGIKHKYIMPLDKAMRKQIEPLRKPYPKRGLIEEQQTPSADGGASPTSTLQT